jgi:hypothetical protein
MEIKNVPIDTPGTNCNDMSQDKKLPIREI